MGYWDKLHSPEIRALGVAAIEKRAVLHVTITPLVGFRAAVDPSS
jgi:hypothetical protein